MQIYAQNQLHVKLRSFTSSLFQVVMSKEQNFQPGEFQWSFLLPKYWGVWVGILFLMILAILPWTLQYRLAELLGNLAFKNLKSRRETAIRNLELCFPEWIPELVYENARQVFIDQMIGVFETLNAWYCPKWFKGRISIQGLEHIQKAQAEGKGALLLGTHSTLLDAGVIFVHSFLSQMWCIARKITRYLICSFTVVAQPFMLTKLTMMICVA